MIEKVLKTIKDNNMICKGDKIVVGVSGGPDSICMLDTLIKLKEMFSLKLYVVHINHMLRGEAADKDQNFVSSFCKKNNISCYIFKEDIKALRKKLGVTEEEAGRIIRYKCFNEVLEKVSGDKIAVGQNMDDQAETFIMRLMRGSGLEGLSGIEYFREGRIIRPLLDITRKEIEEYCEKNKLNPCIDKTNNEEIYTRNKIRLGLIPYIEDNFNKNIKETIWRTAGILREDNEFINSIVDNRINNMCFLDKNIVKIDKDEYNKLHITLKKRIIKRCIANLKVTKDIETIHIDNIIRLISKNKTGSKIDLPHSINVAIDYDTINIYKGKLETINNFEYKVSIGDRVYVKELNSFILSKKIDTLELKELGADSSIKYFDFDKIQKDIVVRNRRKGDRFTPLGMKGTKKLKDFFIDNKVPREIRERTPLLCIGNEVIWIIGHRISEKYKIEDCTKNILMIAYNKVK